MLREPLSPPEAKRLILAILSSGDFWTSDHASQELAKDQMTQVDVVNVLRGGSVEPAEWVKHSWRYRVRTTRMMVVVAFDSERNSPS